MMKKFTFVPLDLAFAWLQLHHDSNATSRQKNKHFSALTNEKKHFLWKSCTLRCVAECLVWVNALTAFLSTRISWLQAGLTLQPPDVQSSAERMKIKPIPGLFSDEKCCLKNSFTFYASLRLPLNNMYPGY